MLQTYYHFLLRPLTQGVVPVHSPLKLRKSSQHLAVVSRWRVSTIVEEEAP